jgi:uncharacterized LabA/DUF88 family protein
LIQALRKQAPAARSTPSLNPKFALLIDGAFLTKALTVKNKKFPTVGDVDAECKRVRTHAHLAALDLLRIYFYDAPPAKEVLTNPIDGSVLDLTKTPIYARNTQLLNDLELLPDFAVRRGEAMARGWRIGKAAMKRLLKKPATPTAKDLVPNISQKGVDLRIGLDISRIALRQSAQVICVITGDSDLIPAFKFARREGLRVYLEHLGLPVRRELKAHADIVI